MGSAAASRRLRTVPLFADLSRPELDTIARVGKEAHRPAGAVLCREGDPGREMFLILDGGAKVERRGRTLRRLGPGDHFGELALLDRGPRSATVEAVTDLTVFVLGELDFRALLDEIPALSHKLLAALATRVRELDRSAHG